MGIKMTIYENLINKKDKLAIIGLGYVGLPLAVSFAEKVEVIGFDINQRKIEQYRQGMDETKEVGNSRIKLSSIEFADDEKQLQEVKFFIVAVPTPVKSDKTPELSPVKGACEIVGRHLQKGSVVVFESTVYPGVTEDVCIPILEQVSGLICGQDFGVGYSPERINPGDPVHRVHNIVKIVSGINKEILEEIAKVYELVVKEGVYRASSIKVAEAAKLAENAQRDINIAFMNELAVVFERMGICTYEVVQAMNTKWNALGFTPGLVGGHCIGVDPYYFIYKASKMNYHSPLISAGRKINNDMGRFIADITVKQMIQAGKRIKGSRVCILGVTFKENCPDIRNTRVLDIIARLREFEIQTVIVDPEANEEELEMEYGIKLVPLDEVKEVDCVIVAVAHEAFQRLEVEAYDSLFKNDTSEEKVFIDVKSIMDREEMKKNGYSYWSL
ncbi:nucleotide sugar dehydrogenase [Anaerosporobacter sp.]|uniref:nucleotide sugar dehydrogenase n=1 Tax=Anaerosporobacter sp. TaxID=1872529 RepID=UPI002F406EF7